MSSNPAGQRYDALNQVNMLDDLMTANFQHLQQKVKNLQVEDYLTGTKSLKDLEAYKVKNSIPKRANSVRGSNNLL